MAKINFKNVGKSIEDENQLSDLKKSATVENRLPLGIQFPLRRGEKSSETLFKMNSNIFDQISNNLKTFIMTEKGELPLKPDFGTLLFKIYNRTDIEQQDLENIAMQDLSEGIQKYFPYVNLIDYESEIIKSDNIVNANFYQINIRYTIQGYEEKTNKIQLRVRRAI